MTTAHTPGPWPAPEEDNSDRGPGSWYEVPGVCNYISKAADARLIAAAPELLAALIVLWRHADNRSYYGSVDIDDVEKARAAIVRATGGVEPQEADVPPVMLRGVQVFIDGHPVKGVRSVTSMRTATRDWIRIDAGGLPESGPHTVRVIFNDLRVWEVECEATQFDENMRPLGATYFCITSTREIDAA